MRCSSCGVALPVFGLLSAIAVFAAQTTATTGSELSSANGPVAASTRSDVTILGVESAKADAPAAVNMNDWQESAIRRGSIRRL